MDLKDTLEKIAILNGWGFKYARRDYQNLTNIEDSIRSASECYETGETWMFIDPIVRTITETGTRYSGTFMILTNSPLDMDYDDKFEGYIRPLIEISMIKIKNGLKCDYDVINWRAIEVINFFDFNADGISINYELEGYN